MGIEVSYRRISPDKFAELQSNVEAAEEFFYGGDVFENMINVYTADLDATGWHLSIEKEWQAIHYLLSGEVAIDDESQTTPPLRNVVMGGTPTEWEATYGTVRYLMPDEVKAVSQFLNQTPIETLRARFDARGNTKLYAQGDAWEAGAWDALIHVYAHLVRFYNQAASQGEVVLISSS
jgi:hypothetical protein